MILSRFEALALLPPNKEFFQAQLEYIPRGTETLRKEKRVMSLDDVSNLMDKGYQSRLIYRKKGDVFFLKTAVVYLRCDKRKARRAWDYYNGLSVAKKRKPIPPS